MQSVMLLIQISNFQCPVDDQIHKIWSIPIPLELYLSLNRKSYFLRRVQLRHALGLGIQKIT